MKQIALDIGMARGPTLAGFFAGPNEAALKHLQLWAGSPTRSPVPTYLWGGGGSGKTHLLKAVAESLREQGAVGGLAGCVHHRTAGRSTRTGRWCCWTTCTCTRPCSSTRHSTGSSTRSRCSAACWRPGPLPPADLKLREDLRTRLGWGHVFQLQVLSEPERRAVLRQAADARGVFLGDEVMDFMLTRFSRDLGSLMQLLEQLDAYALQTQRAITIPLIKSMLENE